MNDLEIRKKCEHKWLPIGVSTKKIFSGDGSNFYPFKQISEKVIAAIYCEYCGEIKEKVI